MWLLVISFIIKLFARTRIFKFKLPYRSQNNVPLGYSKQSSEFEFYLSENFRLRRGFEPRSNDFRSHALTTRSPKPEAWASIFDAVSARGFDSLALTRSPSLFNRIQLGRILRIESETSQGRIRAFITHLQVFIPRLDISITSWSYTVDPVFTRTYSRESHHYNACELSQNLPLCGKFVFESTLEFEN